MDDIVIEPFDYLASQEIQAAVRLTVIDNEINQLEEEQRALLKKLISIDKTLYESYLGMDEQEKQSFIELNEIAKNECFKEQEQPEGKE